MNFSDADVICFDVDYTLVKYSNTDFIHLQFNSLAKTLIKLGAPSELLTVIPDNEILLLAGTSLIADFKTGCLLKLASDHTVLRAYHGLTPCTDLNSLYGTPPKYELSQVNKYFISGERWIFLTHFSLGGSVIWLACVELIKRGLFKLNSFQELGDLLHQAAGLNYSTTSNSDFYPEFYKNPQIYLEKAPESLKEKLANIKKTGKKLAIVTNGNSEYANFIMDYSFGEDWHSIFDAYVYSAGKPEFFYHENELETIEHLEFDGDAFNKGSSKDLKDRIGGHNYVFVGDHYLSDVHGAKQFSWKTVALVEEIFYERGSVERLSVEEIESREYCQPSEGALQYYSVWGSHFIENGIRCYWWNFIINHADAIIPSIDRLFDLFEN